MATETQERHALHQALGAISDWLSPGTNEGANCLLTRLSDPLSEGSLFGGADISRWTPDGTRGRLTSQGGVGYLLGFSGGTPATFPLDVSVDLDTGDVELGWSPPSGPQSAKFTLALVKKTGNGTSFFFDADRTSDAAVYSFTVVLL